MYKILVVDDEDFAVLAISRGIEWHELGVGKVFEAYRTTTAMEILKQEKIDLMICDIEMPGNNGIELLKWVNEHFPTVKTIFLTGHASFTYAQQAVKLNCFEYHLKPVDYDLLKETVAKALDEVKEKDQEQEMLATFKKYYGLWEHQKPVFVERLWQDILAERVVYSAKDLEEKLGLYDIPLTTTSKVIPILIKVEKWNELMNTRDKEIMGFGVRNIAGEIILDTLNGIIIQDHAGNALIVIYSDDEYNAEDVVLKDQCLIFINACNQYLKCRLSCYVGEPAQVIRILDGYKTLLKLENENFLQSNTVIFQKEHQHKEQEKYPLPNYSDWTVLIEARKTAEVIQRITSFLNGINTENASKEPFVAFYHGLANMLYQVIHKNGCSISDIPEAEEMLTEGLNLKSIPEISRWSALIVTKIIDLLNTTSKNESMIIERIKTYVNGHLNDNLLIKDMGNALFFNADYLSRVFKKETGMILSDYIVSERIVKAKYLIENTNNKIADIAYQVGYNNLSHFAKVFRNIVGITPQEYRNRFIKF